MISGLSCYLQTVSMTRSPADLDSFVFRPDYKALSELKKMFPKVPILALSATCPPRVLTDLLATLRLGPKTDGRSEHSDPLHAALWWSSHFFWLHLCLSADAGLKGTVSFSSPLYRRNLHYRVLAKPNNETLLKLMTEYIRASHPNETGIIYCLSQAVRPCPPFPRSPAH